MLNSRTRSCIFCGEPAGSKEHALPDWLANTMGRASEACIPILANPKGISAKGSWRRAGSLIYKGVCYDCNHGWMSKLEGEFSPLLNPFVKECSTIPNQREVKAIIEHKSFYRWLLKTVFLIEQQTPEGVSSKYPLLTADWIYHDNLPKSISGYFGWLDKPHFACLAASGAPIFSDGLIHLYFAHEKTFSTVIILNHLAIRLVNLPGASWLPVDKYDNAFPLPVLFEGKANSEILPVFNTVEEFSVAALHAVDGQELGNLSFDRATLIQQLRSVGVSHNIADSSTDSLEGLPKKPNSS